MFLSIIVQLCVMSHTEAATAEAVLFTSGKSRTDSVESIEIDESATDNAELLADEDRVSSITTISDSDVAEAATQGASPQEDLPTIMDAIFLNDLKLFNALIKTASDNNTLTELTHSGHDVVVQEVPKYLTPLQLLTMLIAENKETISLQKAMLQILLRHGADPDFYYNAGKYGDPKERTISAYRIAHEPGYHDLYVRQILACASADIVDTTIMEHDHGKLSILLSTPRFKKSVNKYCSSLRHKQRQTALQTALQTQCFFCCKQLLDNGALLYMPQQPVVSPAFQNDAHYNNDHPIFMALALGKDHPLYTLCKAYSGAILSRPERP